MQYDFFSAPPQYISFCNKLRELKKDFPFLKIDTIGKSVLGRSIYSICIGNPEKVVLFAGAFHAQEWLTCSLLIRYIEHLSLCYRERLEISSVKVNSFLNERGLMIIPMVNPDGVSIALEGSDSAGYLKYFVKRLTAISSRSWQANAKGVDLNHNYNAGFQFLKKMERDAGITSPSPRQYGGEYPHSEPETRALVSLLHTKQIERVYAFHSQGEEIFYEYGDHTPPQSRYIAKLLSESSGYRLVQNDGLCSHGGFKDYFIDKYCRPGFTIEIGKGENPLPISELESIYSKISELMVIASVI